MAYEKKPNTGSLWDEPKERTSVKTGDKYTYYTGDHNVEFDVVCPGCGHGFVAKCDFWINAFLNTLKTGKRVFNMSFNKKEPKQTNQPSYDHQSSDIF